MRSYSGFGALIALIAFSGPALAWGDIGHEVVCEIAYRELNPQARNRLASLINLDPEFRAFGKSCTWPDHPRTRAKERCVNIPRSATKIESSVPCPGANKSVVRAIANDMADLPAADDEMDQLRLAKSIGHWVGDIHHQPMHVSFEDDHGGGHIDVDGSCTGIFIPCGIRALSAIRLARSFVISQSSSEPRSQIQDRVKWVPGKIDLAAIVGWANEFLAISLKPSVQYCVQKQGECWYTTNQKTVPGSGPRKKVDANDAYLTQHTPIV